MSTTDIISSAGVFLILLAFFLETFNLLREWRKVFYLMNILGASLAFVGCILIHSVPFAVLEAMWVMVAVVGLYRQLIK